PCFFKDAPYADQYGIERMYHVRSRNQRLTSVIRNSERIVKILRKSDNNLDHVDIGSGRAIGDEKERDVGITEACKQHKGADADSKAICWPAHHDFPSPDHKIHQLARYDDDLADRFSLEQSGDPLVAAGCRFELRAIG